jgi:hypothetical protein
VSNGKGDTQRPSSVPKSVRDENWERTFDPRERMRQKHLEEAKAVLNQPPASWMPTPTQDT